MDGLQKGRSHSGHGLIGREHILDILFLPIAAKSAVELLLAADAEKYEFHFGVFARDFLTGEDGVFHELNGVADGSPIDASGNTADRETTLVKHHAEAGAKTLREQLR